MTDTRTLNALTIDVEDYYHVSGFTDRIAPADWDGYESRVVASTHRLLNLFDRHQVKGTFFVLGWVADKHPDLVRDIVKSGHEIGCHSYWHRLVYDLTPEQFREDLVRSRDLLAELSGSPVTLYRAPSFSITNRSLWALDILAEEGFVFDSSIFPIHHDRYGIPDARPFPHGIATSAGRLYEFPASVYRLMGMNLPVSGGGYFRLYPFCLTEHCLCSLNQNSQQPFMFYLHPWEVDPDQPRLPGSFRSRFRHYVNLQSTESKLDRLLERFDFAPMSAVFKELGIVAEDAPRETETDDIETLILKELAECEAASVAETTAVDETVPTSRV